MPARILEDKEKDIQCLYNPTTEIVFGPLFHTDDGEDAEEFLEWLKPLDACKLPPEELLDKKYEWLNQKEVAEENIS